MASFPPSPAAAAVCAAPRLYLIASRESTGDRVVEATAAALTAVGPQGLAPSLVAVQLREKTLAARPLLALARRLREVTARAGVRLFINDRIDIALAVRADGVHLGGHSLEPRDVAEVAPRLAVAISTHAADELARARAWREAHPDEPPDLAFAVFGPVFDTPSKRAFGPPQGLEKLRAATRAAGALPVLALGGLGVPEPEGQPDGRKNAEQPHAAEARIAGVLQAGAHGIACMRAVLGASDPAEALLALARSLDPGRQTPRSR